MNVYHRILAGNLRFRRVTLHRVEYLLQDARINVRVLREPRLVLCVIVILWFVPFERLPSWKFDNFSMGKKSKSAPAYTNKFRRTSHLPGLLLIRQSEKCDRRRDNEKWREYERENPWDNTTMSNKNALFKNRRQSSCFFFLASLFSDSDQRTRWTTKLTCWRIRKLDIWEKSWNKKNRTISV